MNSFTGVFQAGCGAGSVRQAWLYWVKGWALLVVLGCCQADAATTTDGDFGKGASYAARIQFQAALGLKTEAAQLRPVHISWQQVQAVQLQAGAMTDRSSCGETPVKAGRLTWRVAEDGIYVSDPVAGQYAHLPNLSSANIRPREIVYDEKRGEVWLYGEGLYRYRSDNRLLEKLQMAGYSFGRIRKLIPGEYGLWLVAERGIFLLDEQEGTLTEIVSGYLHGQEWVNAAAGLDGVWLASSDSRLSYVGYRPGQVLAATTSVLPGVVAEMTSAGNKLWLLLGKRNGGDYRLAFVAPHEERLNVLEGKYFALQQDRGALLARSYATLFRINPETLNVVRIDLDDQYLLSQTLRNSRVSFIGSSYVYKDGCEIVEHGRFDLSKGWHGPTGMAILDDLNR
ncbi:MAG TPA: hypothetical protein VIU93_06415 [Gallionellaceae bacterium]